MRAASGAQSAKPPPAIAPLVMEALDLSDAWARHPAFAIRSTYLVAVAYRQAVGKVPGAVASAERLAKRIASLARSVPPRCGFKE